MVGHASCQGLMLGGLRHKHLQVLHHWNQFILTTSWIELCSHLQTCWVSSWDYGVWCGQFWHDQGLQMPSQDGSGTPLENQWLRYWWWWSQSHFGPRCQLNNSHEREGIQDLCLLIWKESWLDSYGEFDSMNEALCLCSVPSQSLQICCFDRASWHLLKP